jgi:hypothetical protein
MNISRHVVPVTRSDPRSILVRFVLKTTGLAIALSPLFGCGRNPPPASAEGTLRLNGKPLDNCLVTFLPEPGQGAAFQRVDGHERFLPLAPRRPEKTPRRAGIA